MPKKTKKKVASRKSSASAATMMAKASKPMEVTHMPFSQMVSAFVLFTILSTVVVYLINMFFPMSVVLGNHLVSPFMGALYSMGLVSLIAVGAVPVIEMVSEQLRVRLTDMQWMGLYFVVNAVAIWIVTRFAEQVGLGVSSWMVVIALAAVIDIVQCVVIIATSQKKK